MQIIIFSIMFCNSCSKEGGGISYQFKKYLFTMLINLFGGGMVGDVGVLIEIIKILFIVILLVFFGKNLKS